MQPAVDLLREEWRGTSLAELTGRCDRLFPRVTGAQESEADDAVMLSDRLTTLFSPSRMVSCGHVALDRAFFLAAHPNAEPVPRTPPCGGFEPGRFYEIYGPQLAAKTRFVQNLLASHVRHMLAVYKASHDTNESADVGGIKLHQPGADTSTRTRARSSSFLPLHPRGWDVVVCLTTPAKRHVCSAVSGEAGDAALLQEWVAGFIQQLIATTDVVRGGGANNNVLHRHGGDVNGGDDGKEAAERSVDELLQACQDNLHVVPIAEPNDLLDCLHHLHDALGQADAAAARGSSEASHTHIMSSSSSPPPVHNILLLIDSLEVMWGHASLQTPTSSTHSQHWFAAELHRHIRCCLAHDLGARGPNTSMTTTTRTPIANVANEKTASSPPPWCSVTCLAVNGCVYYDLQRTAAQQPRSHTRAFPSPHTHYFAATTTRPRPFGGMHWQTAADCRLLLEPMSVHHVGLVLPRQSSSSSSSAVRDCTEVTFCDQHDLISNASSRVGEVRSPHPEGVCDSVLAGKQGKQRCSPLPMRCTVVQGTREEMRVECTVWQ